MQSMLASSRLDQLGFVASSVCAVHCVLGAVMAGASGLAGAFVQDERVESLLLASAVIVAVIASAMGYRRHRDRWAVLLVVVGLSLLGIRRFLDPPPLQETMLSVAAAALLIGAHARNAQLLHRLRACCISDRCAAP
jgi:hypothetical protein